MDEYIEEYDFEGKPTGNKILKSYAHKNGVFHSTIHLWLYTSDREILVQKRSKNKTINPDVWDIISVAGHIGYSESKKNAAIREAQEEIGVKLNDFDLKNIGIYYNKKKFKHLIDAEFHNVFISEIKKESIDKNFRNEEVDEIKFLRIDEIKNIINNKTEGYLILDDSVQYYNDVLSKINSIIGLDL